MQIAGLKNETMDDGTWRTEKNSVRTSTVMHVGSEGAEESLDVN